MNWIKKGDVKTVKRGKFRFISMVEVERLENGR